MTATYDRLKLDEAIVHLSKSTLANALKVSPRTLERDLRILKALIQDTTELDHKQNERGYPVNTAKYLILFRALVAKGMSPLRAGETLAEQSFRGVDYLIEQHLSQTIQPIQELINQLLSGEQSSEYSSSSNGNEGIGRENQSSD